MLLRTCFGVIVLWVLVIPDARAATPHVNATAVADVRTIAAGEPFHVGVLYELDPHWHIYWRNPGDSGLPTTVQIDAPDGFEVGPVQWPRPKVFMQPGDIIGYGYEKRVLLFVRVTPPKDLAAGERVRIDVSSRWLVCRELCLPGQKDMSVTLDVATDAKPASDSLFAEWRKRLPMSVDAATGEDGPLTGQPEVTVESDGEGRAAFRVVMPWRQKPEEVRWLPGADPAIAIEEVEVETRGRTTTVRFSAERWPGQTPTARALDNLALFTDGAGRTRGIAVPVGLGPLAPAAAETPGEQTNRTASP